MRIRHRLIGEKPRWIGISELILKNNYKKYAEIGVYDGQNIINLKKIIPGLEAYLIDPYKITKKMKGSLYKQDNMNKTLAQYKIKVHKALQHYDDIKYLYITSLKAASKFKDDFFDIVFIDADH
ncbi:hypothetical protein JW930_05240 [Candidatus Woesearchaeota archaeon]|nr:hypothetical protein [Candidatus Woesearchaeota archaeon]